MFKAEVPVEVGGVVFVDYEVVHMCQVEMKRIELVKWRDKTTQHA